MAHMMKLSPRAFSEIAERMRANGYESAFHDRGDDGVVIDMKGITVARASGSIEVETESGTIEIGTILSRRTSRGMVELALNRESTQLDLDKAREVAEMLRAAIEAAVSDELLYRFLTTKIGLAPEAAAAALLDFRELRQGSRATVYPT